MMHVLATLATYRLARMTAYEDGPADLLLQLRGLVYGRYGGTSWQMRGITCPLCVSFWLSWIIIAGLLPWESLRTYILESLGIAGGVAILNTIVERIQPS